MNDEPIQQLPDIELDSSKDRLNLIDFQGQWLILYFYPRDSTPGCTVQAQDFTALYPDFQDLGVNIVGVSRDSLKSHSKFIEKQNIAFPLISDADEKLCQMFDVIKQKNMYGKVVQGIERSTFIFQPDGKLYQSYRKVRAANHAANILEQLTQLINPA